MNMDLKFNKSTWNMVEIGSRKEITRRHFESVCLPKDIVIGWTKAEIKQKLCLIIADYIEMEEEIDIPTGNIVLKDTIKVGIRRKWGVDKITSKSISKTSFL